METTVATIFLKVLNFILNIDAHNRLMYYLAYSNKQHKTPLY